MPREIPCCPDKGLRARRQVARPVSGKISLSALAHWVILVPGWRRALTCFLAGAIGALLTAPIGFFPALVVTMTIAVWVIDGSFGRAPPDSGGMRAAMGSAWSAAKAGWWLGFGYFLAGLWWLGAAFLVEAEQFAWALPLGVLGLPAGLAIFTAFGFFLSRLLWSQGPARVCALAFGIGTSEWLRGTLLTGFPWNSFGMALGGHLTLGQSASLVGLHGLTYLAVFVAASPALLADGYRQQGTARSGGRSRPVTELGPLLLSAVLLAGMALYGAGRLARHPTVFDEKVRLRIMQPNIAHGAPFRSADHKALVERYLKLSDRATSPASSGIASATHLIWPESAFPFILSRRADALARIGAALPPGTYLVTGAARAEKASGINRPWAVNGLSYFNSIHVIGPGGAILGTYDKVHLVPFGEYLPARPLFAALGQRQFVHVPGGFTASDRRRPLEIPGIGSVAALICYEAIFPGQVVQRTGASVRPKLILNVTDDGWFGITSGPYQHLSQARLRTIEEGLPMVRAANTGISAVVDPYGRVLMRGSLGTEAVLDSRLPLPAPPTVFSRFPRMAPAILALVMLLGSFLLRRRHRAGQA